MQIIRAASNAHSLSTHYQLQIDNKRIDFMEPVKGLEPPTSGLQNLNAYNHLRLHTTPHHKNQLLRCV